MLFVEFDEGGAPSNLDAFAAAFDEGMCTQNRVYREHRAGDVAILAPRVVALAPAAHGGSSKTSRAATCRGSSRASSTTAPKTRSLRFVRA